MSRRLPRDDGAFFEHKGFLSILHQVLEIVPIGAGVMAAGTAVVQANGALLRLSGELLDRLPVLHDGRIGSDEMERRLAEGSVDRLEAVFQCARRDGSLARLAVRKHLVRGDDGGPAFFLIVVQTDQERNADNVHPDSANALTPREEEIARMISRGLSSKEIAQALGVSLRSVETHRYHIRRKLGLGGKGTNLAIWLNRQRRWGESI